MNDKLSKYGITKDNRPKIPATKRLNLTGEQGQQIIKSETKLVLRTHKETFKRLADMS
ncbi:MULTISPECIES: acetyltransferase [unclassified Moraxella]|uniref:acetyltransferase n=1 Tax=unclassified Moraxella TaxID=2685852 RepID=UPI002B40B07C|nr:MULTISPECIES: acetyltransferase [unclassified Moraxella]